MKKKFLKTLLVMLILLGGLTVKVYGEDLDENGDPRLDTPFDGGVTLLVAAALGYGAKKAHDKRKREKAGTDEGIND